MKDIQHLKIAGKLVLVAVIGGGPGAECELGYCNGHQPSQSQAYAFLEFLMYRPLLHRIVEIEASLTT